MTIANRLHGNGPIAVGNWIAWPFQGAWENGVPEDRIGEVSSHDKTSITVWFHDDDKYVTFKREEIEL